MQIPTAVHAQDATFTPPFDFPITFSGNFGEIRANHFHGGLDFKTGGTIGKPVHALAEGYISRIRVTHGSGYVLDVAYNNGYKTINRHISAFVGDVAPVSYTHLDVYKRQQECYLYIGGVLYRASYIDWRYSCLLYTSSGYSYSRLRILLR